MPKEICWERQAKRDFDPLQIWNDAMYRNQRKCTASLLEKNPDYFKELALKSAQKRREMKEEDNAGNS
jgi:hypothetical protein